MKTFKKLFLYTSLAVGVFLLSGCASSIMVEVAPVAPNQTHALVTFVRPSKFGFAIKFGIWDSEKFIGILEAGRCVQYLAEPGEHLFLGRAENWSYVRAELEAGKSYYIIGAVFPGVWKARIAFNPVTKGDSTTQADIENWKRNLKPTAVMPDMIAEYEGQRLAQVRQAVEDFKAGNVKYVELKADDNR
jgi:hypothetical protein